MGNRDLETLFNESSKKLKRGIVFAASLYLWYYKIYKYLFKY